MKKEIFSTHWHIAPFEFPEGKDYLSDLQNIEMATTGLLNAMEANRFFEEACQMIVNAVKIFQMGIFDAAFYSLRQSIETSIGSLFLMANPTKIEAWNSSERGFESGTMSRFLKEKEPTFSEMREKMETFFENIRQVQTRTNKYVHKQGYRTFYTCQRFAFPILDVEDARKSILADFEDTIKVAIGAAAVYRLAIDPLPVLLMDDSMMRRSVGFITEPFSDMFVEKYIGKENIEAYKTTQIYQDYKIFLSRNEEKNDATLMLAEYQIVDRKHAGDIAEQIHLLSFHDNLAFGIMMSSGKIANAYVEGIFPYASDVASPNNGFTIGVGYYDEYFNGSEWNVPYKQAYISRISIYDKWTILEHVLPFDKKEIEHIQKVAKHFDEQYRKSISAMKTWAENQGFEFREEY